MSTWRYAQNGQVCGPVDTSTLQTLLSNGTLAPDALVWKEGMANWEPANKIAELAASIPSVVPGPPPLPASPGSPPPVFPAGPPNPDAEDVEKNKIFAVLAYLGILFLVPLLAAPQSKFARFHTNQGVVLFIAHVLAWPASVLLMMVPFVGCLAVPVAVVVIVGLFVFMILGIINAASGQYKRLPLIGHFELIK
ncbi:MAG: hypothetical protein JWR26_2319 [Pedosphaera sp.]|nr:hypothetical protein [Pedosphaera sp.]